MLGPFDAPPFTWTHISPMMTRPKSSTNQDERRIIVDLSFPPESNVNMAITPNVIFGDLYPNRLPTVDDLASILRKHEYRGYMYSVDISRAYRNFPIDPIDWPIMGITVPPLVYIDVAMPFGARSSSLHMNMIAQFILRFLRQKGVEALIYLDDLVGYAATYEQANTHYHRVKRVMADLGLPLAENKLTPPTRALTWLGIRVDVDARTLSIPPLKLSQTQQDMQRLHARSTMSRRQVQCIAGRVNHLAKVCRQARLFMARILAYLRGHPPGYSTVPAGVKADLKWFVDLLPHYNGISLIPQATCSVVIEADSCLLGGGGLGDGVCYTYEYLAEFAEAHISQLEAINCMAAIRAIVGQSHRGMTIMVKCDNSAAVAIFSSGRGRDPVILACARAIWRHSAEVDCTLVFRHIPGVMMEAADTLSRACISPSHARKAHQLIQDRGLVSIDVGFQMFDYYSFL